MMKRIQIGKLIGIIALLSTFSFQSCARQTTTSESKQNAEEQKFEVQKTDAEWKASLDPLAYKVLRKKETERAFTGKYNDFHKEGIFVCNACKTELFSSETKFESGTGWPSFYKTLNNENVLEVEDRSLAVTRTEVVCATCGGHIGHVFEDGPKPTGLRYCLNSAALDFKEK